MEKISWLHYFMFVLACYRLTHLIVFDKITELIRRPFVKFVKVKSSGETKTKEIPASTFGYLLKCYWCAGIWIAILLGLGAYFFPRYTLPIVFVFSIAGGQSILESFVGVNVKKVDYYAILKEKGSGNGFSGDRP